MSCSTRLSRARSIEMSNSRRGLTGITLAVGLGVAVSTSHGVAHADSTEPGPAPGDPTSAAPPSTDGPASPQADGDSGQDQTKPTTRKRPRAIFDGTRITIRRDNARPTEQAVKNNPDDGQWRQRRCRCETRHRDRGTGLEEKERHAAADTTRCRLAGHASPRSERHRARTGQPLLVDDRTDN